VGTGKTLLCRRFFDSLDKNAFNVGLILNPMMTQAEFLSEVIREFNIGQDGLFGNNGPGITADYTIKDLLGTLEQYLLAEYEKGKETLLAIDEAQLLSDEMLEFLRILSNFETNKEKILHIILFGQKELVSKLSQPRLRYLSQRITVVHQLLPLTENEVGVYINHRLLKAGSHGLIQFTPGALKMIYGATKGYPRVINLVCDRCLLTMYARSNTLSDENVVKSVLKEESLSTATRKTAGLWRYFDKRYYIAAAAFLVMLVLFFLLRRFLPF
jgi:general secretion pathway protein A